MTGSITKERMVVPMCGGFLRDEIRTILLDGRDPSFDHRKVFPGDPLIFEPFFELFLSDRVELYFPRC